MIITAKCAIKRDIAESRLLSLSLSCLHALSRPSHSNIEGYTSKNSFTLTRLYRRLILSIPSLIQKSINCYEASVPLFFKDSMWATKHIKLKVLPGIFLQECQAHIMQLLENLLLRPYPFCHLKQPSVSIPVCRTLGKMKEREWPKYDE